MTITGEDRGPKTDLGPEWNVGFGMAKPNRLRSNRPENLLEAFVTVEAVILLSRD